jgi:hypothetical protein
VWAESGANNVSAEQSSWLRKIAHEHRIIMPGSTNWFALLLAQSRAIRQISGAMA